MNTAKTIFPRPGTKVTYAEALPAYEELERYMLSKVYSPTFLGNVEAYDLIWHLEGIASKQGIDEEGALHSLRRRMCGFAMERTALANGEGGKRFYLLEDEKALSLHDKTHFFEVNVDGEALREEFDAFLDPLEKEAPEGDPYALTYSPSRPRSMRVDDVEESRMKKLLRVGMMTLIAALATCSVGYAAMSLSVCFRVLS